MSETSGNLARKPQDPELFPSQTAMKALCDDILALKPADVPWSFKDVFSAQDPLEVEKRIRASSLGDLMLRDGDSLSVAPPNDYWPDLDLIVGRAKLVDVGLRAWGWDMDKCRRDPDSSDESPYPFIDYPGEKDWIHQLDIKLWYSNDGQAACQTITAYTNSSEAALPDMSRYVYAPSYAESGYEGHIQMRRRARSEDEVLGFVALARELFDSRVFNRP